MSYFYGAQLGFLRTQWRIGTIKKVIHTGYKWRPYDYIAQLHGDSRQNVQITSDKVAQLNTHTIRHSYLYQHSGSGTAICIKRKYKKCFKCHKKCCSECNLCTFNGQLYCGECIDTVTFTKIHKILSSILTKSYNIKQNNIINCIVSLSLGYQYQCCSNIDGKICTNIISFNNAFDFKYDHDMNINKYIINKDYFQTHKNSNNELLKYKFRINMKQDILRIFCSKCTSKQTSECGINKCENILCDKEVFDCCYNHPLCFVCNKYPNQSMPIKALKCKSCHNYFCTDCGLEDELLCKFCETTNDFKKYKQTIYQVIGDIIGRDLSILMARFCSGNATICCNKYCKNGCKIPNKCS